MGLEYGTKFLAGHGVWTNMQAIRSIGMPVDLFYKQNDFEYCGYVSDMMVHLFHLVTEITSGGKHVSSLEELLEAFQSYIYKALARFSVCVLCFDVKVCVPLAKRPLQAKRRSKHEPLSKEEFRRLKEEGEIISWNRIRSTSGARDWILQQMELFLIERFVMPEPREARRPPQANPCEAQESTTLIVHGLVDQPQHAMHFEKHRDQEVEKGTIDVNIIGEGEIQLVYWLNYLSKYMPVVGVSIDKDMIALALLNTLRRDDEVQHFPVYSFRQRKLFHSFVNTPAAKKAFKFNPYQSCPDFTIEPEYDAKRKITEMPFLDINGFAREIESMFRYHGVHVTSPHATWVLIMAFVGCDFVDKGTLFNFNGDKLFKGYLMLGESAPSVVRLTLDDPAGPFRVDFAEQVFLQFVFTFLDDYNRGKKRGCVFERKKVKAAARRACWVLTYWCNSILGQEFVPKSTKLDAKKRSYWGWTNANLTVQETLRIAPRLPADGNTFLVDEISFRKRLRDEDPLGLSSPKHSKSLIT